MTKKNILLLCGGGGTEHDISLISAGFIYDSLRPVEDFNIIQIEICKNGDRKDKDGNLCELRKAGEVYWPSSDKTLKLDFAIPCIHGPPGETGEIQAVFEMMGLPYLGCGPEANIQCFNKITTKLWFDALQIPNTPYLFMSEYNDKEVQRAEEFFDKYKELYTKASNQGSSVGCYHTTTKKDVRKHLKEAFEYSPFVLIEKGIKGRELEVAVYEDNGTIKATAPGEIICPGDFYSFEEKYDNNSNTTTDVEAKELSSETIENMKALALKAFKSLKLRHLSRIDFFYTEEQEVYINEINTFPGMTPISMFPKMMENDGLKFTSYLENIIRNSLK